MKQKQVICFLICTALLFMNPIIHTSAMDGFDMINNMNMDMVLEQSYHAIDSVEFATDHAMDNNMLNNQLNDMMFFPDLLDVINTDNNTPAQSVNDNLFNDIIVAVDNGSWMPEFNYFFNNPTAEIPMDVEMMNVDMNSVLAPAFSSSSQQNTIGNLNNNPDMNPFTNNSDSNNSSELQYASADTNTDGLDWNMETNPEKALLDVQPDDNTDMLNATGGEMFGDELSTKPIDNGSQNMDNNDIDDNTNIGENPVAGPQDDNIISTD